MTRVSLASANVAVTLPAAAAGAWAEIHVTTAHASLGRYAYAVDFEPLWCYRAGDRIRFHCIDGTNWRAVDVQVEHLRRLLPQDHPTGLPFDFTTMILPGDSPAAKGWSAKGNGTINSGTRRTSLTVSAASASNVSAGGMYVAKPSATSWVWRFKWRMSTASGVYVSGKVPVGGPSLLANAASDWVYYGVGCGSSVNAVYPYTFWQIGRFTAFSGGGGILSSNDNGPSIALPGWIYTEIRNVSGTISTFVGDSPFTMTKMTAFPDAGINAFATMDMVGLVAWTYDNPGTTPILDLDHAFQVS